MVIQMLGRVANLGFTITKKPFSDLSEAEKFDNIDIRLNSLRKDANQNSFRVYGIQTLPEKSFPVAEGSNEVVKRRMYIHEILEDVFIKGLGIDPVVAHVMSTTALMDLYHFRESGSARQYCVVFKLNRSDLCGQIFKNLSKLANYQNPYGQRPLTISKNLSEEENRERQKCLAVKDILKSRGLEPRIKKNIFLSVNNGEPKHYSTFLEVDESVGGRKRRRLESSSAAGDASMSTETSSSSTSGPSYADASRPVASKKRPLTGADFPPLPRNNEELTPEQINHIKEALDKAGQA